MDLSIIVPVYKVEKYIHTCIESIYKQGLDEDSFELIIVNDGTPDNSMEMIQDIIAQHKILPSSIRKTKASPWPATMVLLLPKGNTS